MKTKGSVARLISIFMVGALVFGGTSCKNKEPNDSDTVSVPKSEDTETIGFDFMTKGDFLFASGAGAWAAYISVNPDGTFSGGFHDTDAGAAGVDYDGVFYDCSYEGAFDELTVTDEFTYSSRVTKLDTAETPGNEEIIDGIKYIKTEPYGIKEGCRVQIFLPGKPLSELPEDFIGWAKSEYYFEGDTLPGVGIMTTVEGEIFGWMQMTAE